MEGFPGLILNLLHYFTPDVEPSVLQRLAVTFHRLVIAVLRRRWSDRTSGQADRVR